MFVVCVVCDVCNLSVLCHMCVVEVCFFRVVYVLSVVFVFGLFFGVCFTIYVLVRVVS